MSDMSERLDRLDKQDKLDKQEKYRLWIEAPSSRALAAAVSDGAEASIAAGFIIDKLDRLDK